MTSVTIIGSGAWGTALAATADRAGSQTTLWTKDESTVRGIIDTGINPECFPGLRLSSSILVTSDLKEACQANIIVLAVPAQVLRTVSDQLQSFIAEETYVLIASKGIEQESGMLMSEVLSQTLPGKSVGVISGPTFAEEVFRGLPTAVTLAADNLTISVWLARAFNSPAFRVYASDDVIGAQLGGALKNVLAIGCGLVEGRKLGENARAMLMTRGLIEISRLAIAKGGRAETLCGMSGLGDICLTCTSKTSRNFKFGYDLGAGTSAAQMLKKTKYLAEGVYTSRIVASLAKSLNVDMPIATAIDAILNHSADIDATIQSLMQRPTSVEDQLPIMREM